MLRSVSSTPGAWHVALTEPVSSAFEGHARSPLARHLSEQVAPTKLVPNLKQKLPLRRGEGLGEDTRGLFPCSVAMVLICSNGLWMSSCSVQFRTTVQKKRPSKQQVPKRGTIKAHQTQEIPLILAAAP